MKINNISIKYFVNFSIFKLVFYLTLILNLSTALNPLSCEAYKNAAAVGQKAEVKIDVDGSGPLKPFPVSCEYYGELKHNLWWCWLFFHCRTRWYTYFIETTKWNKIPVSVSVIVTNKLCPSSGPSSLQLFRMLAAPLNSFLAICVTTQDNGCLVASGFFT